jgi:hypothetical protein
MIQLHGANLMSFYQKLLERHKLLRTKIMGSDYPRDKVEENPI